MRAKLVEAILNAIIDWLKKNNLYDKCLREIKWKDIDK